MDPYLEAPQIWEDFHGNLAVEIQGQLQPRLRPRYFAALIPRVTFDEVLVEERTVAKPDVSVIKMSDRGSGGAAVAILPAPMTALVSLELPVKVYSVEVREAKTGSLVTAIEILSPVNKRPGHDAFERYRRNRRALLRSSAHLLEIDLLRGGQRPPFLTPLPPAPYFVSLSREERRPQVDVWPLVLRDPVPIVPVPLASPDPDVPLDLGAAIRVVYDRIACDARVDYTQAPPPPSLPTEDSEWLQQLLKGLPPPE
jgi:uncharacterized protein YjiS (DUF1127 family)